MRISRTKYKDFISYYVIKSVTINGKRTSKTVESLGSLDQLKAKLHLETEEEVYQWAKDYAKALTIKEKEANLQTIVKYSHSKLINKNEQRLFNGGYLFLQSIFYELKLDSICKQIETQYKFDFDLTDILSKLIYARILSPSSKASSYQYSKTLIEQPNFDSHHIYRALSVLTEQKTFIEASVYKHSAKIIDRNTNILYYDCTNFFFEINEEVGLKQKGFSKEQRSTPIVQMGLFMDGNGIPLAFSIDPGNTGEQPTLIPLEKKLLKDFELSKFIVCTDAGLASSKNRKFNHRGGRSFIVTQSLKKLKGHLKTWALAPEDWSVPEYLIDLLESIDPNQSSINLNDKELMERLEKAAKRERKELIFYKERWINEDGLEQRMIITYSLKYKKYKEALREKQVEKALKMTKKPSNMKNRTGAKQYIKETHSTKAGEIATENDYELDLEKISEDMMYDGFYAVCTTLEDKIEDIIRVNRRRWEIEESFRIMKSDFKSRPVYLSRDDRIQAHFMTCFLSLLVYRILEKKLEEKYTASEIIETLRDMNFQEIKGEGYVPMYKRTDLIDDLHDRFDFVTSTEIVGIKKMKKIIRQTKR